MSYKEEMTLRDYFAAKALSGMVGSDHYIESDYETLAELAYSIADAMIEERNKQG